MSNISKIHKKEYLYKTIYREKSTKLKLYFFLRFLLVVVLAGGIISPIGIVRCLSNGTFDFFDFVSITLIVILWIVIALGLIGAALLPDLLIFDDGIFVPIETPYKLKQALWPKPIFIPFKNVKDVVFFGATMYIITNDEKNILIHPEFNTTLIYEILMKKIKENLKEEVTGE